MIFPSLRQPGGVKAGVVAGNGSSWGFFLSRRIAANASLVDNRLPMSLQSSAWVWYLGTLIPISAFAYWLQLLPSPPTKPVIYPGLGSLGIDESEPRKRLEQLYPETLYDGGSYAELPLGRIKYWILGYEWCPKVANVAISKIPTYEQIFQLVLISGLAAPAAIWKDAVPALLPHFRLLIYGELDQPTSLCNSLDCGIAIVDHYGRGYSDAPDTTYDTMFYLNELALLMQHVKFEKANLLGLSMVCQKPISYSQC